MVTVLFLYISIACKPSDCRNRIVDRFSLIHSVKPIFILCLTNNEKTEWKWGKFHSVYLPYFWVLQTSLLRKLKCPLIFCLPNLINNSYFWRRMSSSGMWHCVDLALTDVLEERIASIFRVEESASGEPAWAGGCRLSQHLETTSYIRTGRKGE
jgi:hypothetical protein